MPCGYSWDQLLSYETPKVAVIQDRRLGFIYYTLLLLVAVYVLFVVLFEKRYLLLAAPVGSVRFSLQSPQTRGQIPPSAQSLPYCLQAQPTYNGFLNAECIYWDEPYVLYPSIEQSAIFIDTRVNSESQSLDNCSITQNTCMFVDTEPPSPLYYIANIENFTLLFDHSFYAPSVDKQGNSRSMPGRLLNHKGKVMKVTPPNTVGGGTNGTNSVGDILTIDLVLKAAGIDSLDEPSRATPGRSIRNDGIVIMMFIEYSNTYTFNPDNVRYQYQFRAIPSAKFKGEQVIVTKNTANRVLQNRHGIRIIIQQTGQIGKFDVTTLILSVVSGMALMTVTAVLLDYVIKYCRPLKDIHGYATEKYIETEQWGERGRDGYDSVDDDGANTFRD